MKLEHYAFDNGKGELESPFLEYMQKYTPIPNESKREEEKRVKRIRNIQEHLKYLISREGNCNLPRLTEKYKDREVCILKIKEGNTLIRIAYVVVENKIIILDAIDKPSSYQKGQKQKIDKMIQNFLDRVESYLSSIRSLPLNLPD